MRFPRGRSGAAEGLEGLDESREVVHLDRTVTAQEREKRGPTRRPRRLGERRASGRLRAAQP
jgi:hypothetical protein